MKNPVSILITTVLVIVVAWLTYSTLQKYLVDAKNAQG